MSSFTLSRRSMLAALGLGAAMLPSLGAERSARADAPAQPKRLFIMYTYHGTVRPNWTVPAGALGALSPILQPIAGGINAAGTQLAPYANYKSATSGISVIDGVDMKSAMDLGGGADEHVRGNAHALCAKGMQGNSSMGMSIDQYIANKLGTVTAFPSLNAMADEYTPYEPCYYEPLKQINSRHLTSQSLFDTVFAAAIPPDQMARLRARRQSVMDLVRGEISQVKPRLSSEDRQQLDAHATRIQSLEVSLGLTGPVCTRPANPTAWNADHSNYTQVATDLMKVLATAIACDKTRIANLVLGSMGGMVLDSAYKFDSNYLHNRYAHSADTDNESKTVMTKYGQVHAGHFATLLNELQKHGVLDSTTVAWVSEVSTGNHRYDNWPIVVAGGSYFKKGQSIKLPSGTSHGNFLLNLAESMGVPYAGFGHPNYCQAPLAALKA